VVANSSNYRRIAPNGSRLRNLPRIKLTRRRDNLRRSIARLLQQRDNYAREGLPRRLEVLGAIFAVLMVGTFVGSSEADRGDGCYRTSCYQRYDRDNHGGYDAYSGCGGYGGYGAMVGAAVMMAMAVTDGPTVDMWTCHARANASLASDNGQGPGGNPLWQSKKRLSKGRAARYGDDPPQRRNHPQRSQAQMATSRCVSGRKDAGPREP
jgi:hypothetical protein